MTDISKTTEWWRGKVHDQSTHERINAVNYPGTRQLCCQCDQPTGRCADDTLSIGDGGPLCPDCWYETPEEIRNAE